MRPQHTVGSTAGTGVPNVSMMPKKSLNPNTAGPTPQGHVDNFNADNGAVGANNVASPGANSGTSVGNALEQLYQTQPGTLSGGQFPPGAPTVSGVPGQFMGPSLQNSGGAAASDAIQRMNYINGLPWNLPQGAAVNVPTQLAEGPAQPGGMPQMGAILQTLAQNAQLKQRMNQVPGQAPITPQAWPELNLAGGLR